MTGKQKKQFNLMLKTLRVIAKEYQTPDRLRKHSEDDWGTDYADALEMSYENIQGDAAFACKGVRPIK